MKITLKNIHYNERLSDETNNFSADLYINNVKAGEAYNRGDGGPTDYHSTSKRGEELIREAEVFCEGLPPEKYEFNGVEKLFPVTLESYIDKLLEEYLDQRIAKLNERELQRFRQSIEKASRDSIVIGVPDKEFKYFKLKYSIEFLLASDKGREGLKNVLGTTVIPALKDGVKVLNTNIPKQLLQEAGFNDDQYVKPAEQQKTVSQKKPGKKL